MNTDAHGLKRKFVSPSARKDTSQVGTFVYLARDSAVRRFVLICIYLCKSVSQKFFNNRNILKL